MSLKKFFIGFFAFVFFLETLFFLYLFFEVFKKPQGFPLKLKNPPESFKEIKKEVIKEVKKVFDPQFKKVFPYLSKIEFENEFLQKKAKEIVKGCQTKECEIEKIYRFVVENFNYIEDPQGREVIQTPFETLEKGGGDCEDLVILFLSLILQRETLKDLEKFMVFSGDHVYAMLCGISSSTLQKEAKKDLLEVFQKDLQKKGNFIIKDGNLYFLKEEKRRMILPPKGVFYLGGKGEKLEKPLEDLEIQFKISGKRNLSLYIVPSVQAYEKYLQGEDFYFFEKCAKENQKEIQGKCAFLEKNGGVLLINESFLKNEIVLDLKFFYRYSLPISLETEMKIYQIENKECLPFELTAGKYGFPGYEIKTKKEKLFFNIENQEYFVR